MSVLRWNAALRERDKDLNPLKQRVCCPDGLGIWGLLHDDFGFVFSASKL